MEAKKKYLQIIIPIVIALILVALFFYFDSIKDNKPVNDDITYELLDLVSKDDNSARLTEIYPDKTWGCASPETIIPETLKEADKSWIIRRDAGEVKISLGKYRIKNLSKTILDIPKIWLYFFSEELGRENDNLFALQKSFVRGITLVVNGNERELKLGGDEYMFFELTDYPFGDIYPYDKNTAMDFEFFIDLACEDKECLDNGNKSLEYINNADIGSRIRIFAIGCQEFTHDMSIDAKFDFGE